MDLHEAKTTIANVLQAHREVSLAILFGSIAKNRARAGSDVDVAVAGRDVRVLELIADLSAAFGREVDVVRLPDASIPLLDEILRDGIVVHEQRPGQAAQWRSHTLAQLEIDRPWYHRMRDAFLRRVVERGI